MYWLSAFAAIRLIFSGKKNNTFHFIHSWWQNCDYIWSKMPANLKSKCLKTVVLFLFLLCISCHSLKVFMPGVVQLSSTVSYLAVWEFCWVVAVQLLPLARRVKAIEFATFLSKDNICIRVCVLSTVKFYDNLRKELHDEIYAAPGCANLFEGSQFGRLRLWCYVLCY